LSVCDQTRFRQSNRTMRPEFYVRAEVMFLVRGS